MATFTDEGIVLLIPTTSPQEELEHLREAIIDALQTRFADDFSDPKQLQNTTYYLLELLRAVVPVAA